MTHINVLDRIVAVKLDVRIWSGRKKLWPEDLRLGDGAKLPPAEVASLGSKRIVDPERINGFHRLKKEAWRACLAVGTRFLGGYAIPEDPFPTLASELDRIAAEFAQAKAALLADYANAVDEWAARHPDFAAAIRRAVDPAHEVDAALGFDYTAFRVAGEAEDAHRSLERKAAGLGETLFAEIAQAADELLQDSFIGKARITRRALNPVQKLRDKLDGLAFLDARVQPVVASIDQAIRSLPKRGALEGDVFAHLFALVMILSDPDRIKKHGEGLLSLEAMRPVLPPAAPTAAKSAERPERPPAAAGPESFWF
ncbi:MAG: DUF3150 domain-containing protein [Rhodobacteraceae bacterium]|nr:DUF3150 domain-containing protein [Paracoccaceae bacterium]